MKTALRSVYLLRHGETVPPGEEGRYYIGRTDLPLSAEGRLQAAGLAERFAGMPLENLFSSDLIRARETAAVIAAGGAHPLVQVMGSFREIDLGAWDGRPVKEIRTSFPDKYEERGKHLDTFRPPGGESFLDMADRVVPAFHNLLETTEGDILIVSHAGVNRAILCHILGIPLKKVMLLSQGCGCVNKIIWGQRVSLELLNG